MKKYSLRPVSGELFVGRQNILGDMIAELKDSESSDGFCIYGRRRIGKTSLLRELERRLKENEELVIVYFSFWDIIPLSTRAFVEDISDAILDAYQKKGLLRIEQGIKRALRRVKKVFARNIQNAEFRIKLDRVELFLNLKESEKPDYSFLFREVFYLAEEIADRTGTKCIIMLDEFPEILKLENGYQMVRVLRTAHENFKHVGIVISGSIRKTLAQVALSHVSPFYRQLILKKISPLSVEEVQSFLVKYASIKDREIAERLTEITGGVPFYLQSLGRISGFSDLDYSVEEFLEEEGNIIFQEEFTKLNEIEKRIVSAMGKGKARLVDIARDAELSSSTVSTYLPTLMAKEIVKKMERGRYSLTDTMFALWLKRRVEGRSFSEEVFEALETPKSLKEIYDLFPDRSKSSVRGTIYKLLYKGRIKKVGRWRYRAI